MRRNSVIAAFLSVLSLTALGQDSTNQLPSLQLLGFVMTDMGYDFNQVDPNWYDVLRPSKLPSYTNQYGTNGNAYFSVRQTRFGEKSFTPTALGDFTTFFDFDLFGVGVDAGQTTIRLRHAYGQLGHFGAGQTESAFMDIDVFPNTFEYWGPDGMLFFRNVQIRWIPIMGATNLVIALEKPGASADAGIYANRIELQNVQPRFPLPDLSAHYRQATKWGYVQLGGMLRSIQWKDLADTSINLSGSAVGWGLSLSTNVNIGKQTTFRGQVIYGAGVENYFNDAPLDIGTKDNFSNPQQPILGVALPDLGVSAFVDHTWNEKFTSSVGYSTVVITNSNGQSPSDFHMGQYVAANLIYYPVANVMAGVEYGFISRQNYKDGFSSVANRIDFSFKYSFSQMFYKKKSQ
jgi:DcaP outer membrane protein